MAESVLVLVLLVWVTCAIQIFAGYRNTFTIFGSKSLLQKKVWILTFRTVDETNRGKGKKTSKC